MVHNSAVSIIWVSFCFLLSFFDVFMTCRTNGNRCHPFYYVHSILRIFFRRFPHRKCDGQLFCNLSRTHPSIWNINGKQIGIFGSKWTCPLFILQLTFQHSFDLILSVHVVHVLYAVVIEVVSLSWFLSFIVSVQLHTYSWPNIGKIVRISLKMHSAQ